MSRSLALCFSLFVATALVALAAAGENPATSAAYDPNWTPEQPIFGEQVHVFKIATPPHRLELEAGKPKGARIPVYPRDIPTVKFKLSKVDAGYLDGATCRRKAAGRNQERCPLRLEGSQTLEIPMRSIVYMTFGGRWNGRTLSPGKYILRALTEFPQDIKLTLGR
jgi:hypothetical protein